MSSLARIAWWPWALIASAVAFTTGGLLHPGQDPSLPARAALAAWIGDPLWVPSHALILAGAMLLVPGLLGLRHRHPDLPDGAHRAARAATLGALLWTVESVPHLGAATESAAAADGRATPILFTHMVLSLVAYPLVGLSVAALAVLAGGRLAHPGFAVLAVPGGLAWSLAPWLVGPLRLESFAVLFPLGILMALWFVGVGVRELGRRRVAAGPRTLA